MAENVEKSRGSSPFHFDRAYSGVGTVERIASRRERLIDAGIVLFGTVGYHATTMRMLTSKAGLTNRYFYESFNSIEDLLIACYEKLIGNYRNRLHAVLNNTTGDIEPRIRAGLTCFFEAMSDPYFARVTHKEVLGVSDRVDKLYMRSVSDFSELMVGFLESTGVPISSHNECEMQLIGNALAGSVIQNGMLWVFSNYSQSCNFLVEANVKIFLGTARQLQLIPENCEQI